VFCEDQSDLNMSDRNRFLTNASQTSGIPPFFQTKSYFQDPVNRLILFNHYVT